MSSLVNFCSCTLALPGCGSTQSPPVYPPYDSAKWVAISWAVCVFAVCAMGLYAVVRYWFWMKANHRDQTNEE